MRQFFTLAALLFVMLPASAQVIYKCADKSGHLTYSSTPCEPKQSLVKVTPVQVPSQSGVRYQQPLVQQNYRQQAPASVYYNTQDYGYAPTERDQAKQRCSNAKRHREDELARLGLNRTFDDLRRLDDWVAHQCKGAS